MLELFGRSVPSHANFKISNLFCNSRILCIRVCVYVYDPYRVYYLIPTSGIIIYNAFKMIKSNDEDSKLI